MRSQRQDWRRAAQRSAVRLGAGACLWWVSIRRRSTNIGSVFPHSDGKGFNILLEALPLDGKLVLREVKEQAPEPVRKKR